MNGSWEDMRPGVLRLLTAPSFIVVVVFSLALVIGASFSTRYPAGTNPVWEAISDRQHVFLGIFGWNDQSLNLAHGDEVG